jgi:alkylated DNA repair dioxygenase AlkB
MPMNVGDVFVMETPRGGGYRQFFINDANLTLYKSLFTPQQSSHIFAQLYNGINWSQSPIKLFGKSILQPRLTAYYGEKSYTYSGITMSPLPWIPDLLKIKSIIDPLAMVEFNAVLLNLYRDGNDYMGWHSDDERLTLDSVIGSVSFGATRRFICRRKDNHKLKVELNLADGDFLIMRRETQKYWQHQVPRINPKIANKITPRINLTFRVII